MADENFFRPKWSEEIQDEWARNVVNAKSDIDPERLQRTIFAMNDSFPDADIKRYRQFICAVNLPDEKDRHVVAVAIKSRSDVIVTANLRDFPKDYLNEEFGIDVQDPDTFLCHLIDLDPGVALQALVKQQSRLINPPQTIFQVLETLQRCGLEKSVKLFKDIIGAESIEEKIHVQSHPVRAEEEN